MSKPEEMSEEYYLCPSCGERAVKITGGRYIQMLHCVACGWSISVQEWNSMSPEEKKKMYDRVKGRKKRLFGE